MDPQTQRQQAIELFNEAWGLLERPDRSPDDDLRMVHMAHASRFHWGEVGEPVNLARGEWQCSRVYAVLGRAEPALFHARACLDVCEAHDIGDFDLAFAYEALARAHAVAGDPAERDRWLVLARDAAGRIGEEDDREALLQDLATVPKD